MVFRRLANNSPARRFVRFRKKRRRIGGARRRLFSRRRMPIYRRVPMHAGAFPSIKRVKLKYITTVNLNPTAGSSAVVHFRANSVYDPEYAIGGHQPMWSDVYASIYENYRVYFCKINVVPCDNHAVNVFATSQVSGTTTSETQYYAANQKAGKLWIYRDRDIGDYPNNINTMIEEGSSNLKWRYVTQNTSPRVQNLTYTQKPHALLNTGPRDGKLLVVTGQNPEEMDDTHGGVSLATFFSVGFASFEGQTNPDAMNFEVTLTYYVAFSNLKKNQTEN